MTTTTSTLSTHVIYFGSRSLRFALLHFVRIKPPKALVISFHCLLLLSYHILIKCTNTDHITSPKLTLVGRIHLGTWSTVERLGEGLRVTEGNVDAVLPRRVRIILDLPF